MKRTLLTLILATTIAGIYAQNRTEDLTPLMGSTSTTRLIQMDVWSLDTLQLDILYNYWNAYVEAHPKDEQAWRNLYEITEQRKKWNWDTAHEYVRRTNVVGRMEKAIPDSYTFNYCASQSDTLVSNYIGKDELVRNRNLYADRAIELLTDDEAYDFEHWVSYLVMQEDTTALINVLTRYFNSGLYPAEVLQYHFNELQGMDEGAIYFGARQSDIVGKLILQYVLGVHRDKILFCEDYAAYLPYLKAFFRQTALPQSFFEPGSEWFQSLSTPADWERCTIRYICEHSKRPVYFSAISVWEFINYGIITEDMKANIYNEGLTMRYSAKPYDNQAVKRRNVEERYRLEYLRLSFQPYQDVLSKYKSRNHKRTIHSTAHLAFNYLLLFNDLLPYYEAHDPERHSGLRGLFTDIIAELVRKDNYGVGMHNSVYVIREVTEGGLHYELVEDPTLFDEFCRKANNIPDDAAPRVLFKTDPVK